MFGGGQGVCALTICSEPCLVALPSSTTDGTLRIYNLLAAGGNVLCEIAAHKSQVVSAASTYFPTTASACFHLVHGAYSMAGTFIPTCD